MKNLFQTEVGSPDIQVQLVLTSQARGGSCFTRRTANACRRVTVNRDAKHCWLVGGGRGWVVAQLGLALTG